MTKIIKDAVQEYLDNREPWQELRDELELIEILAEAKNAPDIPPGLDKEINGLIASHYQPQHHEISQTALPIATKPNEKQITKPIAQQNHNMYPKTSIDKKTKRTRKNTKIALALVAVLAIIPMTASAFDWKKAIMQFVIKRQQKYSDVEFKIEEKGNYQAEYVPYAPTYIPEGVELNNAMYEPFVAIVYENADHSRYIMYSQRQKDNYKSRVNTEGVELEELIFEGKEAYYYSNVGIQDLMWIDDDYVYNVCGTFD